MTAQVDAINDAIGDLNGFYRMGMRDEVKELPNILGMNELPEKIVVAEYHDNVPCLLVVTDSRLILVEAKLSFSRNGKVRVKDFLCDKITSVEYSPGMARHQITFWVYGNKETFKILWWDGKFQASQIAEYLRSKANAQAAVSDTHTATQVDAINDAFRLGGHKRKIKARFVQQLVDILGHDEIPKRIIPTAWGVGG